MMTSKMNAKREKEVLGMKKKRITEVKERNHFNLQNFDIEQASVNLSQDVTDATAKSNKSI